MRAAPAVSVETGPERHSRRALVLLAAASLAVTSIWSLQRADLVGGLVLAAVAAGLGASLWTVLRWPSRQLRWDGQVWHLARTDRPAVAAATGQISVALDLGDWLLLRFDPPPDPVSGASRCWLPLHRRQIGPQWHALRCAVHGPRLVAIPDAPAS